MSRSHYRCSKCETRHVFKHAPDTYARSKKCRHCGSEKFRVDHWMNRRDTKAMGCSCAGYPEMSAKGSLHRKGSLWCWFRKNGEQRMPGDSDFKDFQLEQLQQNQSADAHYMKEDEYV